MDTMTVQTPVAVVTGASRGLGRALARELAAKGWTLVIDARGAEALRVAAAEFDGRIVALPGDVADPVHRQALGDAVGRLSRLDLLVNNASDLGPTPLPHLGNYPLAGLEHVFQINTVAPLALIQLLLPALRASSGAVVNVTSDAAVEPYPGWGGYGASKAALEQLTAVLGAEEPELRLWSFDPGDMRTQMHQDAFPGEDISDRQEPEAVVPALLRLIDERPPSGRFRASELLASPARRS